MEIGLQRKSNATFGLPSSDQCLSQSNSLSAQLQPRCDLQLLRECTLLLPSEAHTDNHFFFADFEAWCRVIRLITSLKPLVSIQRNAIAKNTFKSQWSDGLVFRRIATKRF